MSIENLKMKYQVPGQVGETLGTYYNENILLTGVMRGCFFLKKSAIEAHIDAFGFLFPKDYTVWSNVPFFAGLRELNLRYGYLYSIDTHVINNDQDCDYTMGKDYYDLKHENIKALVLLAMRNRLYLDRSLSKNSRFVEFGIAHVSKLLGVNQIIAKAIFDDLILIARELDLGEPHKKRALELSSLVEFIRETTNIDGYKRYKSLDIELGFYNTKCR